MDLFIECNVELCKTDCEACPEADQQIEPGRRRRAVSYALTNVTSGALSEPVRMGRGFRVILPDDLSLASSLSLGKMEETALAELTLSRNVCMSYSGFYISFSLLVAIIMTTTMSSAIFYAKLQRIVRSKNFDLPRGYWFRVNHLKSVNLRSDGVYIFLVCFEPRGRSKLVSFLSTEQSRYLLKIWG